MLNLTNTRNIMKKLNTKGFGVVELILIIVIFGLIGGVGYYVYNSQKETNTLSGNSDSDNAKKSDENSNIKLYADEYAGYTIEYPVSWQVETSSEYSEIGQSEVSTTKLTSATGLTLTFEHNFGGRGGDCPPGPNDSPHAPGNICQTSEIIFVEKTGNTVLGIDATVDAQSQGRFKDYDLYLVREKYTDPGASNPNTVYFSGLSVDTYSDVVKVSEPKMGLFVPFSIISQFSSPSVSTGYYVDIKMSPKGNSEEFFNQEDVKQAEAILKSFRFN